MTPKEKKKPVPKETYGLPFPSPIYLDKPTKPIEVEKPINGFDYLNALVRIPEVQKDLEATNKEPDNKEKRLEIINKYWGIYRFSPELLQNTKDFYKHNKYYHNSEAIHVFSTWEFGFVIGNLHFPDSIAEYRDGRHVILAVDVTKKNRSIIKELEKVLNRIEKDYDIPKDTTKDKDTKEDIWEIYDYKTKDRLSFNEIARMLSGKTGGPAYNEPLHNCLKRVKWAYHKAKKIINTVEQKVKETIIANAIRKENDNKSKEMLNRMIEESKKERTISIGERLVQGIPKKERK